MEFKILALVFNFVLICWPKTKLIQLPRFLKYIGTSTLSRCYDDEMKLNLLKNTAKPQLDHT